MTYTHARVINVQRRFQALAPHSKILVLFAHPAVHSSVLLQLRCCIRRKSYEILIETGSRIEPIFKMIPHFPFLVSIDEVNGFCASKTG